MSATATKLCEHRVPIGSYCARCDDSKPKPWHSLKVHPAADLFPMMGDKEIRDLADDISAHGLLDPILLLDGKVLDGRNRLRACDLAGETPRFKDWRGDQPTSFVISANLHRRQLSKSQLAAIGAEAMPLLQAEAKQRQRDHGGTAPGRGAKTLVNKSAGVSESNAGRTRQVASEQLGGSVSGMHIQRAASVKEVAPEIFEEIKSGKLTVGGGLRKAGLNSNGTRGAQKVSPQRRHGAVIAAAKAFGTTAEKWDEEMCVALSPPEARKQLTVLRKASDHLVRVIEAVEYRAAKPHGF